MAMLSANSALVAGSVAGDKSMANQKIQVVRPFWFFGKQHFAGAVLEVPAAAAGELVAMGKATKYDAPPPQPKAAPRVEPPKDSK
jgi:hypothetical protein